MQEKLKYLQRLFTLVLQRFAKDQCGSIAAQLTVTSLLALVPMTTLILSLLSLLPSYQQLGEQLQSLVFRYFAPETGQVVQQYLGEFVGKARSLSGVGVLTLLLTALLMMRTIDRSFNHIWRVKRSQSWLRTFLVYWAVLTLGPLLLGTSLLITSYIKSLPLISDVVTDYSEWFTTALPFMMEWSAFMVLFMLVPNRRVPWRHAALAALLTSVLFELAKIGFTVFVKSFSTYQFIFGALASLPLFLIWIYLAWLILLYGAEFCHALDSMSAEDKGVAFHPFIELCLLLESLLRKQRQGKPLSEFELSSETALTADRAIMWLQRLKDIGWVMRSEDKAYGLLQPADKITPLSLLDIANCSLPSSEELSAAPLNEQLSRQLLSLRGEYERLLSTNLLICP